MKFQLILVLSFSLGLVQYNCASRARPGGGPVDKIPPEIIEVFPSSDSNGIGELDEIRFIFSERMNEASVKQSIFISPPLKYELSISGGDEVVLSVMQKLLPEQTYVVTVGSGAKDMRNNLMEQSFQLAFSTGATIDRGKISGTIYGIKSQESFFVYAYRIQDPDSLNPMQVRADYLSQPGKKNDYTLDYLAPGDYRVFVVEDQNRNLRLDADYEQIGIPYTDVRLDSTKNAYHPLNFFVSRIDTTKPFISGIRSLTLQTLQLRFSEPIQSLMPDHLVITDTLKGEPLEVYGLTRTEEALNQFLLFTAAHDSAGGYRLQVAAVSDTNGNRGTASSVTYAAAAMSDTTGFRIAGIAPRDSAKNLDIRKPAKLEFSKAVNKETVESNLICRRSDGDTLRLHWKWIEHREARLWPETGFMPGSEYHLELHTENILSLWNESLPDTIIYRTFFAKSPDEYGSISGFVRAELDSVADVYVYIRPVRKKTQFRVKASSEYRFIEPWLPEDNYQVGGFVDSDRNQKLSTGSLIPFNFAEPFNWNSDTVRVRKRWEMSDIELKIPRRAQ